MGMWSVMPVLLQAVAIAASSQPPRIVIARDTPVELMATREVTTATARAGDLFPLRVTHQVVVDGRVVIPAGTPAEGEVVAARDAGGVGKTGRMTARLLHVRLGETLIPLDGDVVSSATGAGSPATAALLTLNPLALIHRGNNTKIKAGQLVHSFVAADTPIPATAASGSR